MFFGCHKAGEEQHGARVDQQKGEPEILYVSVFKEGKIEMDGWVLPVEEAVNRIEKRARTETRIYFYYVAYPEEPHPNAVKIIKAISDAQLYSKPITKPKSVSVEDGTVKRAINVLRGPIACAWPTVIFPKDERNALRTHSLFGSPTFLPEDISFYRIKENKTGRSYPVVVARYGKLWIGCVGTQIRKPWCHEAVTSFSDEGCLAQIRAQHGFSGEFLESQTGASP